MFVKSVIVLLLLIVVASLLAGRGSRSTRQPLGLRMRTLMFRVAIVLLLLSGAVTAYHLSVSA